MEGNIPAWTSEGSGEDAPSDFFLAPSKKFSPILFQIALSKIIGEDEMSWLLYLGFKRGSFETCGPPNSKILSHLS